MTDCQPIRNWSELSEGTSRIISECSSGDTEDRPAITGYGGQTSYHYGAVGHWSAGLGELQGDGIREISASFWTGG